MMIQKVHQILDQAFTRHYPYGCIEGINDQANNRSGNHDLHEYTLVTTRKKISSEEGIKEYRAYANQDFTLDPRQPQRCHPDEE